MEATVPMWTIEQLAQAAQAALQADYWGQPNRQASDLPTPRAIRYYTMLGLLDRPVMRGRTAYYTRRHLAQLVAIKRLQAEGLPLVEIQQRLYGLTDDALEQIARLPAEATPTNGHEPTPTRRRRRFWTEPVAPIATPAPTHKPAVQTLQAISLTPHIQLVLAADAPLDPDAVEQLQRAARPLLRALAELGVLPIDSIQEGGNHEPTTE
jgi:DNA-binding transcriptional MerR regulator